MKKQLTAKLINDLQITNYEGETNDQYFDRLLYSAIAEWMRFCILDRTNEQYTESKTKRYIRIRCEEILKGLLKMYPESYDYFYSETNTSNTNNPINIIRENMIENGELIQINDEIWLPKGNLQCINEKYQRYLGIIHSKAKYVGITRIIKDSTNTSHIETFSENHSQYFESLKKNLKWEEYDDVHSLEVMNPYLKKAPYQCWANYNFIVDEDVYLSRIQIKNGLYDYFWLTKVNNKIKISKMNQYYREFEEHRRFILWQRKQKGNPISAIYKISKNYVKVKMNAAIPHKEQQLFNTYGWPFGTIQNKREYVLPLIVWNEMKEILIRLNFNLMEE